MLSAAFHNMTLQTGLSKLCLILSFYLKIKDNVHWEFSNMPYFNFFIWLLTNIYRMPTNLFQNLSKGILIISLAYSIIIASFCFVEIFWNSEVSVFYFSSGHPLSSKICLELNPSCLRLFLIAIRENKICMPHCLSSLNKKTQYFFVSNYLKIETFLCSWKRVRT